MLVRGGATQIEATPTAFVGHISVALRASRLPLSPSLVPSGPETGSLPLWRTPGRSESLDGGKGETSLDTEARA